MSDEYKTLKILHGAGCIILGIEDDGNMHAIPNPQWSCPADRYMAVMPITLEFVDE